MARHPRQINERRLRPNYFVFCEGETEVAYVTFLGQRARKSIHILPLKQASNINARIVRQAIQRYVHTPSDKTYLMFDLDVKGMLERLQAIPDAQLLVSNPCFELWLLLHFKSCNAEISTRQCLKLLEKHLPNYKKGCLGESHQAMIMPRESEAKERASKLASPGNPSSTVHLLLNDMFG